MTKKYIRITLAALLAALGSVPFADAQMAQNWDVEAHSRAEIKNSAGLTMLGKKQVDAACDMFRKASMEDPTNSVAYSSLGMGLAMHGRYQEALDALQKSYQLRQTGEALLTTGIVYYLMHDYDAAINAWNKILEANPRAGHVHGDIAFAFMRKGDFVQAEQSFDKLVKYSPHSEFGYYGLGLTKYLEGDFRGARAAVERAELVESYPPAILLLAKLDMLQGDKSRGLRRAQLYNALTRKPLWKQRTMTEIGYPAQHDVHWDPYIEDTYDNGFLLTARSLTPKEESRRKSLSRQGKAVAHIEEIQQKLADHPDDFFLRRELGLNQLADGDFSSAAEAFEKVLADCPKCEVDLLHWGRALALDGRAAEASAKVREYRKIFPSEELSPVLTAIGRVDPNVENAPGATAKDTATKPRRPSQQQTIIPSSEF